MDPFSQPYYIGGATQDASQQQQQQQQQQKMPVRKNGSESADSHVPMAMRAEIQSSQPPPFPGTAAPSAYAFPTMQQTETPHQFNFSHSHDGQLSPGNMQASGVNPPPSPYALPQRQVVYLHGGGAASISSLGRHPVLMGPPAANVSLTSANAPVFYPAMPIPSANGNTAVAYYVPGTDSQQQQQQQQQSVLLDSSTAFHGPGNANTRLSYLVLPTQQMDQASMTAYATLPFTAYVSRRSSGQNAMQDAMDFAPPNAAMAAWPSALPPQYTNPPPLQKFPATATTTTNAAAVDDKKARQKAPSNGEVPSTASAAVNPHPPIAGGANNKNGSTSKPKHHANGVDAGAHIIKEVSITSQSTSNTQGLPYAEDPVEIDTTKRQLIVNYLPQRLTDERFKELFRPYGELMEEESHIIHDFRHHKMIPVPSSAATTPATKTTTPLSFDKDTPSSPVTAITTMSLSNMDLTSLGTHTHDDTTPTTVTESTSSTTAVEACSVPRSKGYGFIYYKDGASTERAIKELNGKEVDGKRIKVRYAQQQRCLDPRPAEGATESVKDIDAQMHSTTSESEVKSSDMEIIDNETFEFDDD
ncbi:putative RNA-binding protein 4 [Leptomonas pyrrhocoris]|uniref:Putative RNA-binding protein 4 n=1 Tax=Leptomonas pyrrhocoris TaxID=157538 RepID=A0A0N0DXE6_LEPPY|nr:putative RNA-binding protein 4 [Leptomonas pyrrhocoris]XP_015661335.1 putative RNA-binding protein 4 [Leptomonas pyrrhocoris]KPA82895.1 putative RNA-binding protein 4 [Leptomonas pyrrhocoris]KPA82896.1 putative RNA-binding protein 4 [Leptomonas pyrrhocoris]|eukprot:XP_015661334.1 putative RNA-binding protein 4 [Leptomonas pyrrhocoris]